MRKENRDRRLSRFAAALLAGSAVALLAATAAASARYGSYCEAEFENHWHSWSDYVWERCDRFNDELNSTDEFIYYRNLHSADDEFETTNDENGMERGALVFINTHGGYAEGSGYCDGADKCARWAMWDEEVRAHSSQMYLGNEAYGLSILASYACHTHYRADGYMFERWGYVFEGGLRMSTGSHGYLWDGYQTDEVGEDFADDLQGSMKIKNAWKSACDDWYYDQDTMVFASGITVSQCTDRRDNMKWQNFGSYSRIRDEDVNYICWESWDNL